MAYSRSKLGDLWLTAQLQQRHPELLVTAVHPGIVDTNLGLSERARDRGPRPGPMLSRERGAQTSLLCATAPDLMPGGYYHNVHGLMDLRPSDPARDERTARELWETCERLCADWSTPGDSP